VIEHREALIDMLCEAAELEYGIMCQYLFATFSLKREVDTRHGSAPDAAISLWTDALTFDALLRGQLTAADALSDDGRAVLDGERRVLNRFLEAFSFNPG
jgi:hypothetical protein